MQFEDYINSLTPKEQYILNNIFINFPYHYDNVNLDSNILLRSKPIFVSIFLLIYSIINQYLLYGLYFILNLIEIFDTFNIYSKRMFKIKIISCTLQILCYLLYSFIYKNFNIMTLLYLLTIMLITYLWKKNNNRYLINYLKSNACLTNEDRIRILREFLLNPDIQIYIKSNRLFIF